MAVASFSAGSRPRGRAKGISTPARRISPERNRSLLVSRSAGTHGAAARNERVEGNYGALPVSFERNQGQAASDVLYLAHGPGYTLQLNSDEAVLSFAGRRSRAAGVPSDGENSPGHSPGNWPMRASLAGAQRSVLSSLTLRLAGANPSAPVKALGPLPGRVNYYIGSNPRRWHTNIPTYAKVKYRGVYPGIDLYYDGSAGMLESHFILKPGAKPGGIRLVFTASMSCRAAPRNSPSAAGRCHHQPSQLSIRPRVARNGDLVIRLGGRELRFKKPVAFQPARVQARRKSRHRSPVTARTYVGARYILLPNGEVGFAIAPYDRDRPLVIDPVLTYATYTTLANLGVSVAGIRVDSSGNAYVFGSSGSSTTQQAFVFALDAQGNSVLYTTYFGNSSAVYPGGIAVDSQGDVYIDGTTGSGFTTTPGAFSSTCPGACTAGPFAAELSPSGTLQYATYLGPTAATAHSIAIDSAGDAYITGGISSTDLPLVSPLQTQLGCPSSTSCGNAFVQELDPTGSQLLFSSYFGGNGTSSGSAVAVDSSGNIYVLGSGTTVPLKNPLEQGVGADFLAKFAPGGASLVYSTLLGGSAGPNTTDSAVALAVDGSGDAYVTGDAISPDFPFTMNAYRVSCMEEQTQDCTGPQVYVMEVSPTGASLLYSTLVGSGSVAGISLDSTGNVWIVGTTTSNYFPTVNPIQAHLQQNASPSSHMDAFVTRLNSTGVPNFSTYLGGSFSNDSGATVAVDGNGNAYVAGTTQVGNDTPIDFPIVNPAPGTQSGEVFYTPTALFAAKIDMASSGPVLSLSPWYVSVLSLRDVSTSPLTISSITPSSNMTVEGGTCGTSLSAGGDCTLIVYPVDGSTFSSGALTVSSNALGSPQTFTLNSNVLGVNQVFITPSESLSFPVLFDGASSTTQTVKVTNLYYPNPVGITSISSTGDPAEGISGDFSQTNNCPASLAPGDSCQVTVQYQPASGTNTPENGQLNIATNISTPTTLYLFGAGSSQSLIAFMPPGPTAPTGSDIQFGIQYVGATPLPRVIPLVNTSNQSVSIGGVSTTGPFTQTNNCPASLSPFGSCRVAISFLPQANGIDTGTLKVTYGGQGGNLTVSLGGTGELLSSLGVSPLSLNFGSIIVGSSYTLPLQLSNSSSSTLTLSPFSLSPGYTETDTCNGSLAPAATCTANITFAPTVVGSQDGTLSIAFSGGQGSPQVISLTGTGRTPLEVSPSSLTFSQQLVNTVSSSQSVTMANMSSSSVTINSITVSPNFQIVPGSYSCLISLAPNYACIIDVSFAPTTTGTLTGNLSIDASDSSAPHLVSLTGTGINPAVSLSATSLAFTALAIGSVSAPQTVTLQNTGVSTLDITNVAITGDFSQTNTCGTSVAAGGSCSFSVTFAPTTSGQLTGSLSITDDASGSPQSIPLTGTGTDFSVAVAAGSSASQTISAGQSATYSLALAGTTGFDGSISLSCTGAPTLASCAVNPAAVALNGTSIQNATVTVNTTASSIAAPGVQVGPGSGWERAWPFFLVLVVLFAVCCIVLRPRWGSSNPGPRAVLLRRTVLTLALLGLTVVAASCGGGGGGGIGSSGAPPSSGTPSGSYNLTVTGTYTSGGATLSHTVQLTLTVQ